MLVVESTPPPRPPRGKENMKEGERCRQCTEE